MSLISGFTQGAAAGTLDHWKDVKEKVTAEAERTFKERMQGKRQAFQTSERIASEERADDARDEARTYSETQRPILREEERAANKTKLQDNEDFKQKNYPNELDRTEQALKLERKYGDKYEMGKDENGAYQINLKNDKKEYLTEGDADGVWINLVNEKGEVVNQYHSITNKLAWTPRDSSSSSGSGSSGSGSGSDGLTLNKRFSSIDAALNDDEFKGYYTEYLDVKSLVEGGDAKQSGALLQLESEMTSRLKNMRMAADKTGAKELVSNIDAIIKELTADAGGVGFNEGSTEGTSEGAGKETQQVEGLLEGSTSFYGEQTNEDLVDSGLLLPSAEKAKAKQPSERKDYRQRDLSSTHNTQIAKSQESVGKQFEKQERLAAEFTEALKVKSGATFEQALAAANSTKTDGATKSIANMYLDALLADPLTPKKDKEAIRIMRSE